MLKDVKPATITNEQPTMQALQQYGGYIVSAILLVLAGYFGWQSWQNHGGRVDTAAANDFAKIQNDQNALDALATQPTTDADSQKQLATAQTNMSKDLSDFVSKHDKSVYTWQALMLQAKQQTDRNEFKAAATSLQQASQLKLNDEGLTAVATLRYAQVLLADQQIDAAQKALQVQLPAAFEASKLEILGDIANQKNDKKAAANYYQQAWQLIEQRNSQNVVQQDRAILRLKMESLGLAVKQPDLTGGVLAKPEISSTASSVAPTSVQADASSATH